MSTVPLVTFIQGPIPEMSADRGEHFSFARLMPMAPAEDKRSMGCPRGCDRSARSHITLPSAFFDDDLAASRDKGFPL
jgi:hypothetical protein